MPTQLLITEFLNAHFAGPVDSLLHALHVQPASPAAPITNSFAMELLVFAVLVAYFIVVRLTLSVEKPAPAQHLAEMTHEFVSEQGEQIIGHGFERFTGYLTVLLLFILLCNLLGLIPGLESPTANVVVPLGFALVTFVYYHYHGVRAHGFAYIKQFLGPVWWLSWLIFPVEIISTTARILSLTVRLWANILASELIYNIFLGLFVGLTTWGWTKNVGLGVVLGILPALLPIAFIALHIFVAIVQAYIFTILPSVYLGLATADEHE